MNTLIYLWIEPLVMNHKKCNEKIYFNCTINGDYSKLEPKELENIISGKIMGRIMDYANIESNWNFEVLSAKSTRKEPNIEIVDSPEKIAKDKEQKALNKKIEAENKALDKKIVKIISSSKEIELSKSENVEIKENGIISVSLPSLKINEEINFSQIWENIEKNFIGKIKEGDVIKLTDEFGNELITLRGGSFLNIGISDLKVYNAKKMQKKESMFNWSEGLKGGLFLRDNGDLDIGDLKRTVFITINTRNLLKSSLKLKMPLNELTSQKLLNKS